VSKSQLRFEEKMEGIASIKNEEATGKGFCSLTILPPLEIINSD